MPITPNYGLYYPNSDDRPAAFPAAQETSQLTLDGALKQVEDSVPAALSAAKTDATNKMNSVRYFHGEPPAGSTLADLATGTYWIHTSTAAQELGLPEEYRGSLVITRFDWENAIAEYTTRSTPPVRYFSAQFSNSWRDWEKVTTGDPAYTSGTRDLSGSVHTDQGWNPQYGPTVKVDRYGPVVELTVESLQRAGGSATGNFSVIDLPTGFRPSSNKYPQTWRDAMAYVHVSGLVRITHPTGPLDYFSVTYMTKDAPPTTLPGTPA